MTMAEWLIRGTPSRTPSRTPSMGNKGRELDRGEMLRLKMNGKLSSKEREIPRC